MIAIETEQSNNNLEGNEVLMKIGGYLNENKTVNYTRVLSCCFNHLMTHNQQICKTLKFAFKLLQNYIGVGLSRDSYRMKNSDVVACVRDGILFLFIQISK